MPFLMIKESVTIEKMRPIKIGNSMGFVIPKNNMIIERQERYTITIKRSGD